MEGKGQFDARRPAANDANLRRAVGVRITPRL
jgi:hypothetical protein